MCEGGYGLIFEYMCMLDYSLYRLRLLSSVLCLTQVCVTSQPVDPITHFQLVLSRQTLVLFYTLQMSLSQIPRLSLSLSTHSHHGVGTKFTLSQLA